MDFFKNKLGFGKKQEVDVEEGLESEEEEEHEQPKAKEKVKNFPPCYPLFHHSWKSCGSKRYLAILGFSEYILTVVLLIVNLIANIISLVTTGKTLFVTSIAIAACYVIFYPILGIFLQYWVTYSACSHKSSIRTIFAFISYGFGIVFFMLCAVGLPSIGGAGLVAGLWLINVDGGTFAMIFNFIMSVVWVINCLINIVMVLLFFKHFNDDGSTLSRAKDQIVGFFVKRQITSAISGVTGE
ncbi:hypothetical protein ABK040_014916 [Willaertia magna]